jgi:hypothetical protein
VVHVVLGPAHHLCGGNPLLAARALCPVPPGAPTATRTAHYCNSPFHTPRCADLIQLRHPEILNCPRIWTHCVKWLLRTKKTSYRTNRKVPADDKTHITKEGLWNYIRRRLIGSTTISSPGHIPSAMRLNPVLHKRACLSALAICWCTSFSRKNGP